VAARAGPRESWEVLGAIETGRVGEKETTSNMNACKVVCAYKFIVFLEVVARVVGYVVQDLTKLLTLLY
jgi:hypothetical protein